MRPIYWLALFGLCLLSGSRWLFTDALPSTLLQQAIHFLIFALAVAVITRKLPKDAGEFALVAILLFAFPLAAFGQAAGHITPYTQTIVFTFVPAVVVFAVTQQTQTFGPEPGTRALFIPALAGVLGALLLIPVTLPSSPTNQLRLALIILAMLSASLAGIRLHRMLASTPLLPAAWLIAATCGVVLGLLSFRQSAIPLRQDLFSLVFDNATLLLTLYVLRDLHPIRAATRFLLVPLITILEGLLLLRPQPSAAMVAGLLLLAFACAVLLKTRTPETA